MSHVLVMLLVALVAGSAPAATPTQKCTATKTNAAGKTGSANGSCAAKAAIFGVPPDPICLQKASDKLSLTYTKAELKGGCLTTGDAAVIDGLLDGVTTFAAGQLGDDGSLASRKCASSRRKATGKYVADTLKCWAKAALFSLPVDGVCLAKAGAKLTGGFDKSALASGGNCDTVADATATTAAMDAIVGDVIVALNGGVTTTTTAPTTTTTTLPPPVSFAGDVQPIFSANCVGCHSNAVPNAGLDLGVGSSHGNLVSVASSQCGATFRVDPGSPSTSYLVHKLQGAGPCFVGSQMPLFGSLSPAQHATISTWITEGALNN